MMNTAIRTLLNQVILFAFLWAAIPYCFSFNQPGMTQALNKKLNPPKFQKEKKVTSKRFVVRPKTEEITIVIIHKNKSNYQIIKPDGKALDISKSESFLTKLFSFITLKSPSPGRWKIIGLTGKFNKAIILDPLGISERTFDNHLYAGQRTFIYAYLTNNGERVDEKDIVNNTDLFLSINDHKPILLNKPSDYEINYRKSFFIPKNVHGKVAFSLQAKSKTFSVIKRQMVKIENFPFKVQLKKKTQDQMLLHITTNSSSIVQSQVSAKAVFQNHTDKLVFNDSLNHNYHSRFTIKCFGKKFKVIVNIKGRKLGGKAFELSPITFTRNCKVKKLLVSEIEPYYPSEMKSKIPREEIKKIIARQPNYKKMFLFGFAIATGLLILSTIKIMLGKSARKNALKKVKGSLRDAEDDDGKDKKGGKKK